MSAADDLYEAAAARIRRLTPAETVAAVRRGALLIDLRPTEYRWREGEVSGAIPVPRHVMEWRLDPHGQYRLSELSGPDQEVVLMCSEGYSSALSADLAAAGAGPAQRGRPGRGLRGVEGRRPSLDQPRPHDSSVAPEFRASRPESGTVPRCGTGRAGERSLGR